MDGKACMMFSSKLEKIKTTSKILKTEIHVALTIKQIKGKEKETQEKKNLLLQAKCYLQRLNIKDSYRIIHDYSSLVDNSLYWIMLLFFNKITRNE